MFKLLLVGCFVIQFVNIFEFFSMNTYKVTNIYILVQKGKKKTSKVQSNRLTIILTFFFIIHSFSRIVIDLNLNFPNYFLSMCLCQSKPRKQKISFFFFLKFVWYMHLKTEIMCKNMYG